MPKLTGKHLALSTVNTFNDLVGRAAKKGSEMLSLIWKAGETAKKAKGSLPHGEWMEFVERHYDVNHRTVTRWIKFYDTVPESKLGMVSNLTAGLQMIEPPEDVDKFVDGADPWGPDVEDNGKDDRTEPDGHDAQQEAESPDARDGHGESGDSPSQLVNSSSDGDLGKCPNCGKSKWNKTDYGTACQGCGHPHGEPRGDPDEERVNIQRLKIKKTIQALMRAVDDMDELIRRPAVHKQILDGCKWMLGELEIWK